MAENVLPLAHLQRHCPECLTGHLVPVRTADAVNLLCEGCGACWHVDHQWFCRIDPAACPGCPSRGACVAESVFDTPSPRSA